MSEQPIEETQTGDEQQLEDTGEQDSGASSGEATAE